MTLVDQHPAVQAVDAKLADLERRRADFEARVAPLAAEDAKAEAEYHKAVDVALLEGGPMPTRPVRQIPEGRDAEIRHGFVLDQRLLIDERHQAVAAAYDDVLREARRRAKKLVAAARPTVEKVAAEMAEWGELLADIQTCRNAANTRSVNGIRDYHDDRLTVEEYIRFAATGGDPTDILDLPGRVQPRDTGMLWPERNTGMLAGDIQQLTEDTRARA